MAEPDIRVDTTALDTAGAAVERTGAAIAATARGSAALAPPEPAWSAGFDSVGATARVGGLWREALERVAAEVEACGAAMRTSAAAWEAADRAAAESLH